MVEKREEEGNEEAVPTPEEEFEASWKEEEKLEAAEEKDPGESESPEKPSEKAEDEGEPEAKEGTGQPQPEDAGEAASEVEEKPPVTPPVDREAQALQNQRSLLGRITAQERGLEKMRQNYRGTHGRLPTDETPEQKLARADREKQIKEVDTKLPEVRAAIDDAVSKATERILGTVQEDAAVQLEELTDKLHFESIATAHPDFEDYLEPQEGEVESEKYSALKLWITGQPYGVGTALMKVFNQGYPDEVSMMLSAFKEDQEAVQKGQGNQVATKTASSLRDAQAQAAEAVPASNSGFQKGNQLPDADNFTEAYNYWAEEEKREEAGEVARTL